MKPFAPTRNPFLSKLQDCYQAQGTDTEWRYNGVERFEHANRVRLNSAETDQILTAWHQFSGEQTDVMNKQNLTDLAIFGGTPEFDETLHVGRPNIGDRARLMQRFDEMLDRRWLSNRGPLLLEFEEKLADYLGVQHCIAMCNATVALEIATRALDMQGEVIVPSFTFVATAHALQWQEITPVFADVAPGTHNIDPASIERMITPRHHRYRRRSRLG